MEGNDSEADAFLKVQVRGKTGIRRWKPGVPKAGLHPDAALNCTAWASISARAVCPWGCYVTSLCLNFHI